MVQQYLNGERPITQVGYEGVEDNSTRKEGEIWTDSKGKTWIQKSYGKTSHTPIMDIVREETNVRCTSCKKEIRWGTKQDEKMFSKTGMCLDCLVEYETRLKLEGKWAAYEQKKLFENELGYILDIKAKVKDGLEYMKTTKVLTFVNSNGLVEEWNDVRRNDLLKSLKKDHVRCLKEVKRLTEEIEKLNVILNK